MTPTRLISIKPALSTKPTPPGKLLSLAPRPRPPVILQGNVDNRMIKALRRDRISSSSYSATTDNAVKLTRQDMKKSARYDVVSALFALCAASFGTEMFLFFSYFNSHPTTPNPSLGLIHALNNHGSYVYLSETEWTGLSLLRTAFAVGLFSIFLILPKDPGRAPAGTARWVSYFYVEKPHSVDPPPRLKIIFLCSILFYIAVIYLAGPVAVHLLVSRGIFVPEL